MLEVLFQNIFLLYLSKDLQQHESAGFSNYFVPKIIVYFGKTELPKVLVSYLVLITVSQ